MVAIIAVLVIFILGIACIGLWAVLNKNQDVSITGVQEHIEISDAIFSPANGSFSICDPLIKMEINTDYPLVFSVNGTKFYADPSPGYPGWEIELEMTCTEKVFFNNLSIYKEPVMELGYGSVFIFGLKSEDDNGKIHSGDEITFYMVEHGEEFIVRTVVVNDASPLETLIYLLRSCFV